MASSKKGLSDRTSISNIYDVVNGGSSSTPAVQSDSDKVAANLDCTFREYGDKASQLTDIMIADATAEVKKLVNQLDDKIKLCKEYDLKNKTLSAELAHLKTENLRLAKEIEQFATIKKANESFLKQNEDVKNDLRQCELKVKNFNDELLRRDIQIDQLVKDNDELLRAKNAFIDRLKMLIQDISTTEIDIVSMETTNKRMNDTPLPIVGPSTVKRLRLASNEGSSERKDKEFVKERESSSVGDTLVEPLEQIVKKPLSFARSNCRRNIEQVMSFKSLTPHSQMAIRKEKERKNQYEKNVKSYTETYGILPGRLNELDKLVLDFDPVTKCELLTVDARLSSKLKPHQCEGVKFMWDACFESIDNLRSSDGSGCILAHCMGLGKTLQVITLVHTLMTNSAETKVLKVLIICLSNVIINWLKEFEMWQKDFTKAEKITIYELISRSKNSLMNRVNEWSKNGGVIVVGYGMFHNLVENEPNTTITNPKIIIRALISADLIVCDEVNLLNNPSSKLRAVVNNIPTLRRIILTATTLKNNLKEYYSMVEFVKPSLLGTEKEFNNRFVSPIWNGQCVDSTDEDITLMKQRALTLHKYLEGCVHRRDYSVLAKLLPPKVEYALLIRLTKKQMELYKYCVNESSVFDVRVLKRICNHPKVLTEFVKRSTSTRQKVSEIEDSGPDESAENIEWWKSIYEDDDFELSGKMMILFSILLGCKERNEKLLVFSGSFSTLNVIEQFLSANPPVSSTGPWTRELDYFRFDGYDSYERRRRAIGKFNDETDQRARLFLIFTKTEGMGINLMAANRVIIFDVPMNFSNDVSIFRAYRIGRTKECFIYRFVALGTIEEKIYDHKKADLQQLYSVDGLDPPAKQTFTPTGDELLNSILQEYPDVVYEYRDHDSILENVQANQLSDKKIGYVWDESEAIECAEELD